MSDQTIVRLATAISRARVKPYVERIEMINNLMHMKKLVDECKQYPFSEHYCNEGPACIEQHLSELRAYLAELQKDEPAGQYASVWLMYRDLRKFITGDSHESLRNYYRASSGNVYQPQTTINTNITRQPIIETIDTRQPAPITSSTNGPIVPYEAKFPEKARPA